MQQQPNRHEYDRNARMTDQNGQRSAGTGYDRPDHRVTEDSPYDSEEDFSRYATNDGDRFVNDRRYLEQDVRRFSSGGRQGYGRGQYEDYGSQGRRNQRDGGSYGSQNNSFGGQRQQYGDRSGSSYPAEQQMDEYESDYKHWRDEQVSALDSDYQEFQKERRKKFSEEFNEWRKNRPVKSNESKPDASSTGVGNTQGRR